MGKRIAIIQGHPDPKPAHLCHGLATAYARGAEAAGHQIKHVRVAELEFPLLRTKQDFDAAEPPPAMREAQGAMAWANHLAIFYPLWLGDMPALLKGFFEQTFRPGFAAEPGAQGRRWKKLLTGRSARLVVTMGMPALAYRLYYRAHSVKSLEQNILGFAGVGPVRRTLIGLAEAMNAAKRERWLSEMEALGRRGE